MSSSTRFLISRPGLDSRVAAVAPIRALHSFQPALAQAGPNALAVPWLAAVRAAAAEASGADPASEEVWAPVTEYKVEKKYFDKTWQHLGQTLMKLIVTLAKFVKFYQH